jgi:glycosyltransferase involved in cell wall biosynthesis
VQVVFLNRFYWPDEPATAQLLTDLAESLAATGFSVRVVTSAVGSAAVSETRHGVLIERVRSTRWGRRSLVGRAVDFATFHLAAAARLSRCLRRGDVVVALTDPPLIGLTAALVAALRGARLVHWVQDIYPEIAAELTGYRWLLATRPLRDRAWRFASACVVPGSDMAAAVRVARVPPPRIVVVPNWAPANLQAPSAEKIETLRTRWGLGQKFVAAYSGNLGRVHDLMPLLDVAEALRDESDMVLLFIGQGAQRAPLETAARRRGLANVRFLPAQPREHLSASLAVADVHFVTLRPGAEQWVFPSKIYGAADAGRPVVVIAAAGCELARLVGERGFGHAFVRGDVAGIAACLRRLRDDYPARATLGAAARSFAAPGATHSTSAWHRLLAELVPPAGTRHQAVTP